MTSLMWVKIMANEPVIDLLELWEEVEDRIQEELAIEGTPYSNRSKYDD